MKTETVDGASNSPEMDSPAPVVAAIARTHLTGLHVFLVEDDDADAYLVSRVLAKHRAVGRITRARDGVEALEMIDRGEVVPDLAIVDLHMPRKNGFELLASLACRGEVDFPCAVLTSSASAVDVIRSKVRGALFYLTKPAATDVFEDSVSRLVDALGGRIAA